MTNENKWPKKIDGILLTLSKDYEARCWNACHDAFMKVIEAQPAGLVALDSNMVHKMCYQYIDDCEEVAEALASDILVTFGTPSHKVLSVEEIGNIILNLENNWRDYGNNKWEVIAQAIHSKLTGEKQ